MKPTEARVFIIEDDPDKRDNLTTFIETNGGQVTGWVNNRQDGHSVVNDPSFPESVNNANVVLLDGNLSARGGHGTDGKYIFQDGYERAVLHRVDTTEGIGAVAVGCSFDGYSAIAYATGGNIDRLRQDETPARWAAYLEPHPVEPVYLDQGVLERMDFRNGYAFADMLHYSIAGHDNQTLNVHQLSVTETKSVGGIETVTYRDELSTTTEINQDKFVTDAGDWQGVDGGYIRVDTHTVKALVEAGGYLYVINYLAKVVPEGVGKAVAKGGKVDKTSMAALNDIPESYWQSLGLVRPTV